MIIESLSVANYRVFSGEHTFDLNPRVKYGKKRPIILFGGLNGSGKTSILSAIRLALYGKLSLGTGVTQKDYDEYLVNSVHKVARSEHNPSHASVEVKFTYAKLGEKFEYKVLRGWKVSGKQVKENISIYEDGRLIEHLTPMQCQGFLNELVPIGLSNLFFFDGEKISELAEDTKGNALGDAIKRLIGLDQFDVLANDLGAVMRNNQADSSSLKVKQKITKLELELSTIEDEIQSIDRELTSTYTNWKATQSDLEKAESGFYAKGGAWADSYEQDKSHLNQLIGKKQLVKEEAINLLSGDFPISLAPKVLKKVESQLIKENEVNKQVAAIEHINENKDIIADKLSDVRNDKASILRKLNSYVEDLESSIANRGGNQSLSEASYYNLLSLIENSSNIYSKAKDSLESLKNIADEIDSLNANLSRAPTQEAIHSEFKNISDLKDKENTLKIKCIKYAENQKQLLFKKLTVLRELNNLTESTFENSNQNRVVGLAASSRNLIKDFSSKLAKMKIKDLEQEFLKSFDKLSRKEDIKLEAKINPKTFSVEIVRDGDHVVDKNELSAGEKQIYAIAILEALARTSGRKLPVIIDTPLGRLDSLHRSKLVDNYFPTASHQVIILSTDTEVDKNFYTGLSKHISHAYRLDYDSKSACSTASEGYFWRSDSSIYKEAQ